MTELPDTSGVSDKEHVDLGEGLDTTMSALCSRMTELGHAMDHLPEVDPEGHSSDPDAETGYARKENAAKYVELRLNDLRPAAGALQREIKRKRKQLDIVEGDRGQIHNADARERYDISAGALRHEIDSLQAKLEAVEELMREAEQSLSEARQRKWPRGKPEERNSAGEVVSEAVGPNMDIKLEIELLSRTEFQSLFPDAQIDPERWCGLTKSYVAIRKHR